MADNLQMCKFDIAWQMPSQLARPWTQLIYINVVKREDLHLILRNGYDPSCQTHNSEYIQLQSYRIHMKIAILWLAQNFYWTVCLHTKHNALFGCRYCSHGIEMGSNSKTKGKWKWAPIEMLMFGCSWKWQMEWNRRDNSNSCLDVQKLEL